MSDTIKFKWLDIDSTINGYEFDNLDRKSNAPWPRRACPLEEYLKIKIYPDYDNKDFIDKIKEKISDSIGGPSPNVIGVMVIEKNDGSVFELRNAYLREMGNNYYKFAYKYIVFPGDWV